MKKNDFYPFFLSVVIVIRNQSENIEKVLSEVTRQISLLVSEYELIIVDNGSEDESLVALKRLTEKQGLPNLQIYGLTKEVDIDIASWAGLENALGDFVAVIDPFTDDIAFLPTMLDKAVRGADVVFATNQQKIAQGFFYRCAHTVFNVLYKMFNGINLAKEAPSYRVLSKRVINFILQHSQPAVIYRHLPATGGFARVNLAYSSRPKTVYGRPLGESIERGICLLVSTTRMPMRVVTFFSLFGALANLLYSVYIIIIALFKKNVAPGWVSLSLQQSGMFFLISLVLLVLGEYILHVASLSKKEEPLYHVGQEFTSVCMKRAEKLNIEETSSYE